MKRYFLFLLFFLSVSLQAQGSLWNVLLYVEPYPTSFYSVWENNKSSSYITVNYTGVPTAEYKVRVILKTGSGKELARLTSPLETFITAGSKTIFAGDFLAWSDNKYDNATLTKILRTNRFPEGYYEEQIVLINTNGDILAQATGNFTIIYPDAASLLDPQNQSSEWRQTPIFTWTPVNLPPTLSFKYNLKIVKIFPGQSPNQALRVNPAYHEVDITNEASYLYPVSALPLENGQDYVWRVRVVDDNGNPLTANDGNSEFWTFTYITPGAGNSQMPFTAVDLLTGAAWFNDFSQLQLSAEDNNYKLSGTTKLYLRLTDGVVREFQANVENLTFRKNKYNPFSFSAGKVYAILAPGALPVELITKQFTVTSVEFTAEDKLYLKGQADVPGAKTPLKIPAVIPIKRGGILEATIRYRSRSENILPQPGNKNLLRPSELYAGLSGGSKKPLSEKLSLFPSEPSLPVRVTKPADGPIYSFGNSAVKINITGFEIVYPEAVSKFSGELRIFNDYVVAQLSNVRFNAAGELTGQINTSTPLDLNFISGEAGKYAIKIGGVSGSFSYEPTSGAGFIDMNLKSAKFTTNVSGLFSKQFSGIANFNANVKYSSSNTSDNGFIINSMTPFEISGTTLDQNPIKFGNSFQVVVNSASLDSLVFSDAGFDFKMNLNATYRFPGLKLNGGTFDNISFTKKGIALPGLYSKTLVSDSGSGTIRNLAGFRLEFSTVTSSALLWNGGTASLSPQLAANLRFSNFPVGSSDDLITLSQAVTASLSGSGLTINIPAKTFTSSFIALPGDMKYMLKEMRGSITGTISDSVYLFANSLKVKGDVQLPEGVLGLTSSTTLSTSSTELAVNGYGRLSGNITGITSGNGITEGVFTVSVPSYEIKFTESDSVQSIEAAGSGKLDLTPLLGTAANANVTFRYNLIDKTWNSLSGEYSGAFSVSLPKAGAQFRLQASALSITRDGLKINGRHSVLFGSSSNSAVSVNNLVFRFANAGIVSGEIVFDKGFGLRVNTASGSTSLSVIDKSSGFPSTNGVLINAPASAVYNKEGLVLLSGSDSAYLTHKSMNYKTTAVYEDFKVGGNPFVVRSGRINLLIGSIIVATLSEQGFSVDESLLPALPEKIALLNTSVAFIKVKNGNTELVDWVVEGTNIRVQTKANQPVNAVFPSLKMGGTTTPEMPVTFNLLLDKTNYDIVDGSIQLTIPSDKVAAFNLTGKGLPLQLKTFSFAKNASLIYELSFGASVSPFGEALNTENVSVKIDGTGALTGDFSFNANKNISMRSGTDADKLIFRANEVTGSFNTELMNYTAPQYQIDITGGVKLKITPNSYSGGNAKFRLTESGIEVLDYTADDFTTPVKYDLGKLNLELKAFRLPEIRYSTSGGWSYIVSLDAVLNFSAPGVQFSVPQVNNITITNSGLTFPVTQLNGFEALARKFVLNDFTLVPRNFRNDKFTVASLDPASFNINNTSFRFDFSVSFTSFPAIFPTALRSAKLYIQNAGYVDGFLSGKADSVPVTPFQNIAYGNSGRITIMELAGSLKPKNNVQSFDAQVEAYVGFPVNLRAPGFIVFGTVENMRQSISGRGIISGTFPSSNSATIRLGNADFVYPQGSTVSLTDKNGLQGLTVEANSVQAKISTGGTNPATGSGRIVFDLMNSKVSGGSIQLSPAFTAKLPFNNSVYTFEFASATVDTGGVRINGNHNLVTGSSKVAASFTNFVLSYNGLAYNSGSFSITGPFAYYVTSAATGTKWEAVASGSALSATTSMLFNVPSLSMTNNKITLSGESTGKVNYNGQLVSDFRVVFENSPEFDFSASKLRKGSIAFYKGTNKAAFIDTNGMNMSNMGSVIMPEKLVLGDSTNAFIRLRQGDTKYVTTENVANGLKIKNIIGQTVQLVVPGLKYTAATAPVYNITLDVVVNPTTYALVSGTVSYQAASGQIITDLSQYGIPLKITRVKYASGEFGYTFTADGRTALPQVLSGLETELANIGFRNGKLNGFVSNGNVSDTYNPTAGYKKSAKVGTMAEFKMQGVEYTFGQTSSYKLSGDVKSKFFKSGNDTSNIHFTAAYSDGEFVFSPSNASTDGLKIDKMLLVPAELQDKPAMALGFTSDNFALTFNGSLKAPEFSSGFETTVKNLRINKDGVLSDSINITTTAQEQSFTLFATDFKLKNTDNRTAISYSYTGDVFAVKLFGSFSPLGKEIAFKDFRVSSNGTMAFGQGSPVSASSPLAVVANRFWVSNLSLVSENNKYQLKADGQIQLPAPNAAKKISYSIKINANQNQTETKNYTVVDEAPGLGGNDSTEVKFWAGKFDLQYVRLAIDFSDYSASQIQTVSTFYVDGVATQRYIKFGGVSGGTVEPGMSVTFEGKYEWTEELDFADEVKFRYNNLKYDLDGEDVEFVPDTTNGSFVMKINGSVELGVTGFSGTLAFRGLEVASDNTVKKFKESITGGTVTIAPLITAELSRFSFSSTPTDIYMPDPNGSKVQSGPDKGKVTTIKVPVQFYLVIGGTVQLGRFAEGGVDSLLVFQKTDGTVNFVLQNFNFRKKDKIEFRLSITLLTGTGSDFYLSMAGFCDFNGKVLTAVGKVAQWQGKFSAGLFVAALEGIEVSFFGLVDLAGLGGGFFYNPTEADINTVRDMCGFVDESTTEIKNKIKGAPVTGTPLFTIFVYARIEFGQPVPPSNEAPLAGNCLLTIANDRLIIDAKVEALGRRHELYGLANVEVSFTQKYVEGTLSLTIDLRYIVTGSSTLQFFYYSQNNWGIVGTMNYKVLVGLLSGNGDLYLGNKGFFIAANFNAGFDVWIVTVEGGLNLKAWYKPDVSWGAYFRLYLEASVLGGLASARGEVKGVLIVSGTDFSLAGGSSLRVSVMGISWTGDIWIRLRKDGVAAGFGKDQAVQRLIAQAEGMSNDFLKAVNDAKSDLQNNKPLPSLNITPEIIDAAKAELVKKMLKARSLTADNKLSQAESDSIGVYLTTELASGDNATIRSYLTKLKSNITAEGTDTLKTELTRLMNELNSAIADYKSSIAGVSEALSNLAMSVEVPAAYSPDGVLDPVENVKFTFPTTRNATPQSGDPTFELNAVTASNNQTIVNSYIVNAQGFHDMLKRNIEKIEGTIYKFDLIFANPYNKYLAITGKYILAIAKAQFYIKKLAQYYYNDITSVQNFRTTMISDSTNFLQQVKQKDFQDGGGLLSFGRNMKGKTYHRWARIRGLAGKNTTPWDATEFETVWGRFSDSLKLAESQNMAKNLYLVIPDQAFFSVIGERKNILGTLDGEFRAKVKELEEHAGAYTRLLDDLFAKRRKMSENLFEVVERFIYWKDKPAKSTKDKTVDYKNVAPSLTTLQAKRSYLVSSNTAPTITVNQTTQTNYNSHSELSLGWSASHVNGIVDYAIETSNLPGGFKTIGKFNFWYPYQFPSQTGEHTRYVTYKVRARSASGFTKTAVLFSDGVQLGFKDRNIGAPAQPVSSVPPVDRTYPYFIGNPTIEVSDMFRMGLQYSQIEPGGSPTTFEIEHYYTSRRQEFRIKFNAIDNESGISSYRYRIRKRDGAGNFTVIRDWQNIGAINEYLIQGVTFDHCATQTEIQRSNYNYIRWRVGPSIPKYLITIECVNGAGLTMQKNVAIVIDTTSPPKPLPSTTRPPYTIRNMGGSGKTVTNWRYDTTSAAFGSPVPEARQIVFPMTLISLAEKKYYYSIFTMPDGIRINSDWIVDDYEYIDQSGTGADNVYQGKPVTIPAQYKDYNQFKIELMIKGKNDAVSPTFTTTDWYYPYRNDVPQFSFNDGRRTSSLDAYPLPPEVYWFNDKKAGNGSNNLKLAFKTVGQSKDGTGINKYIYSIGTYHSITAYLIPRLTWADLPPISDDGTVAMNSAFFAPFQNDTSWFKPGADFYVYIRSVNNSLWAGDVVSSIGPITLAPPSVANISLNIVKDSTRTPKVYVPVLTIGSHNFLTKKTYMIRTQVFRNNAWVDPPAPITSGWVTARVVNSFDNYWLTTKHELNAALNVMPFRTMNSAGTYFNNLSERWRVLIKVQDNAGNESDIVTKEIIW